MLQQWELLLPDNARTVTRNDRMVTTSLSGFGWIDQSIGDSVFGVSECGIERDILEGRLKGRVDVK